MPPEIVLQFVARMQPCAQRTAQSEEACDPDPALRGASAPLHAGYGRAALGRPEQLIEQAIAAAASQVSLRIGMADPQAAAARDGPGCYSCTLNQQWGVT